MAQSVMHMTQSRYYTPVFNAAVFDGPVRIYFAQHQEPLALKVYFRLQESLKEVYPEIRPQFRSEGQTVFVMLYPNRESFENAFAKENAEGIMAERLGNDHVIGVCGPLAEEAYEDVFQRVRAILQTLDLEQLQVLPEAVAT